MIFNLRVCTFTLLLHADITANLQHSTYYPDIMPDFSGIYFAIVYGRAYLLH